MLSAQTPFALDKRTEAIVQMAQVEYVVSKLNRDVDIFCNWSIATRNIYV